MNVFLAFTVILTFVIDYVTTTETTKEPPKDDKSTLKMSVKDHVPTPDTWDANPHLNSLWAYHPPSYARAQHDDDNGRNRMVYKSPQSLTRLAKTVALGFDPYFNRAVVSKQGGIQHYPVHGPGYFEPFERRPKPVTLVGIRKNGLFPKKQVNTASKSSEVAELQSPYNDISSFWIDEPGNH